MDEKLLTIIPLSFLGVGLTWELRDSPLPHRESVMYELELDIMLPFFIFRFIFKREKKWN